MALSSEQIEAIRERIDIVRVIGAYVPLKKQGQRYLGLCPFHAEKTPSFSVSAEKKLYYCFGCHAGGDVFSFLMRHRGLDFHEAARALAKDAGVELEPESENERRRRQEHEELSRVNGFAQAFFAHELWQPAGAAARAYLGKRGLPEAFARDRQLGFGAPSAALFDYLAAKKVPMAQVAKAGLLSDDGRRCLFEGRLTFPIFDAQAHLAGFGGRRLADGNAPKYINSRETALFSKRRLLYGLDVAAEAIRRAGRVVVVEGYMDVLACQRAGIQTAVAALGTALTAEHAAAVARLCKEALLVFDGDSAGINASHAAAEKMLASGLKTLVAPLPAGRDPDSLLREAGADALRDRLAAASPAVEHFLGTAFAEAEQTIEERALHAREVAPLILALPAGLERDLYLARLAEKVGVSVEQLKTHLRPKETKKRPPSPPPITAGSDSSPSSDPPRAPAPPAPDAVELEVLRDLLLHPELKPKLADLTEFCSNPMRLLLEELATTTAPNAEVLARHLHDPKLVLRLSGVRPYEMEAGEDVGVRANRTFDGVLRRLKRRHVDAALKDAKTQQREAKERGEDTTEVDRRVQNLVRRRMELKRSGPAVSAPSN
ncbi:MAG: DNA primase [Deltaproteobacteria bacterium]|nr:DNA primase [Deltaproteobacteria bacterium]